MSRQEFSRKLGEFNQLCIYVTVSLPCLCLVASVSLRLCLTPSQSFVVCVASLDERQRGVQNLISASQPCNLSASLLLACMIERDPLNPGCCEHCCGDPLDVKLRIACDVCGRQSRTNAGPSACQTAKQRCEPKRSEWTKIHKAADSISRGKQSRQQMNWGCPRCQSHSECLTLGVFHTGSLWLP